MKKTGKTLVMILASAMAILLAGCTPNVNTHTHTFAEEWTSDATYHWHAATCEHTEEVKDKAEHSFGEWSVTTQPTEKVEGQREKTCTVCGYKATEAIAKLEHTHTFAATYTSDDTHHWYAATCEHTTEVKDNAEHIWNDGVVTKEPTTTENGVKTFTCTVCQKTKTESVEKLPAPAYNWYESPVDAETGKAATASSKYIYFGVFPKTVLPEGSTVTVDETDSVIMGANTYYKGSDGKYYAKVKENAHCTGKEYNTGKEFKYSDGTQTKKSDANSYRYFKVEPIKWKVLTTNYNNTGKALLLAEDILTANVPYYNYNSYRNTRTVESDTNIYPNNYKYSQIRAYLNGLDYYYDQSSTTTVKKTDYTGNGFLQTAFTATAQSKIAETVVDNSADSTTDAGNKLPKATTNACANTTDKIFLLSEKEVTTTAYGFAAYNNYGQGNARIRVTTDYAKANYAYWNPTDGYGGEWLLRSPFWTGKDYASCVNYVGHAYSDCYVHFTNYGLVPALCLSFQ